MKYLLAALSILLVLACQQKGQNQSHHQEIKQDTLVKDPAQVQSMTTDDLASLLSDQPDDIVLLDVRTPEEVAQGQIPGSLGINYFDDDFEQLVSALDPEKTYIVYCRSGNRSGKAGKIMVDNGFREVYNLKGGYTEWKTKEIKRPK